MRNAARSLTGGMAGFEVDRWANETYCYLTTTGRRTGRPHTVEIWFGVSNGRLYLLSGGRDRSDWVRNLRAEPRVRVRVSDGPDVAARARVVSDPEEDAAARRLLAGKYQGWR